MDNLALAKPRLHFSPPNGWMNDPNGLIFYEGEWHLFYQYQPPGTKGKHWGHAVSADLFAWTPMPIALYPDDLGEIFSGSCVADTQNTSGLFEAGGGLVAIFTHHLDGQSTTQSQSLAYSCDKGRTWLKYAQNPVLRSANPNFRDPKVFWHTPSESWVMVLAAGDHAEIYRSPDLKTWTFASAYGKGESGIVWECPDLFPLRDGTGGEVWILSISFLDPANFRGKVGACDLYYFSGWFDGYTFTAQADRRRLSQGPDDYAAVTVNDAPEGRRVLLGWLNHWGYSWYSGQMTLPRELSWHAGAIMQKSAIAEAAINRRLQLDLGSDEFSPVRFSATPWELVIHPGPQAWRLEVLKGGALIFSLQRNRDCGVWSFQRASASFPPSWENQKENLRSIFTKPNEAPLTSESSGATRIVLDTCSVEIFCEGGRLFFAAQIFPPEGDWEIRRS